MTLETLILDLIANGGTHGLLIVAIIVLWRENRRLQDKLEQVRNVAASTHALTLEQNAVLSQIKAQTNGFNQREGIDPDQRNC